jgi:hypothetical protein
MLSITVKVTLPFRQYFHNRRSVTCGEGSSRPALPERQHKCSAGKSCLAGSITLPLNCRRSSTCGYENYVLSGRRTSDRYDIFQKPVRFTNYKTNKQVSVKNFSPQQTKK